MKFLKIVFFLCFLSFISTEVLHQNKGNISVPRVKRKRATINNELEIEYTREDSDDVNCEISVRDLPLSHPIFLNEHSNVIIPINGLLRFHLNDRFKVHCGQSEFSTGGKEKTVECTGKNEFKVELNGVKVIANINDINSCSKEVTLTAVKGNKCEGGDFIHMRFIIDSHGYFDFYSSCYNEATVSTVYNKYTLYGKAFDKKRILRKSSSFKAAVEENEICDDLYKANTFHRGHLMPYADGIYPGWRKQSNYFINAKPQKPSINIGAWSCLERAIREEAMLLKEDLQVFTGAFDSSSFLESASGQIEVHKFWYKIVLKRQTGMAFISCNDENDICKDKLAKCCTDICVSTKWGILKTVQNKKVICCALNEFHNPKNNVPKIPETIGITQILVSARNPPAAAGA